MRVSHVQLQAWMETYQPPLPQAWMETSQPPLPQFDFHQPTWCLYNGQGTYAEDCQYTQRTGLECSMKHKKRYSYQGWEYSDANKCTGHRVHFHDRTPNPGGARECTLREEWRCPGCVRQQDMLRRQQQEYEARWYTSNRD
jgi:hypothetical protein